MKVVKRRFDSQKSIRLYMVDIYKKLLTLDSKNIKRDEIDYYKLNLSILKDIAVLIEKDDMKRIERLEQELKNIKDLIKIDEIPEQKKLYTMKSYQEELDISGW